LSADLVAPTLQPFTQLCGPLRMMIGEVRRLTEVFLQIEKFEAVVFVVFQQLPIARSHSADGRRR